MNSQDRKSDASRGRPQGEPPTEASSPPIPEGESPTIDASRAGDSIHQDTVREGEPTAFHPSSAGPAVPDNHAELPGPLGDYVLVAKLGEGGMGAVYRARHRRLQRDVAIKVLSQQRTEAPGALARFEREMAAAGQLAHENIVVAHDAGQQSGVHYLAMELVEGLHLGQLAQRLGPMPAADACEAIRQAACGLEHAHQRGMVHRDIKPSNLMLTIDSRGRAVVKVLDLGLARLDPAHDNSQEELTAEGQLMGTVDYMAPEQTDGRNVGPWSDIFSLGATLYRLLTGTSPYGQPGQTLLQKLAALSRGPAPSIRGRRPDLPSELADLIDGMISPDPLDRPRTAADVERALAKFSVGHQLAERLAEVRDGDSLAEAATSSMTPPTPEPATPATFRAEQAASVPEAGVRWGVWLTVVAMLLLLAAIGYRSWKPEVRESGGGDSRIVAQGTDATVDNDRGATDSVIAADAAPLPAASAGEATMSGGELGAVEMRPREAPPGAPLRLAPRSFKVQTMPTPAPLLAAARRGRFAAAKSDAGSRFDVRGLQIDETRLRHFRQSHPHCRVVSDDPDRDVAYWFCHRGGSVRLDVARSDGPELETGDVEQLPPQRFAVVGLHTQGLLPLADRQVRDLRRLERLYTLRAPGSLLTDRGLPPLAQLATLRELDLTGAAISDEGVAALTEANRLTYLNLSQTPISDAALPHLAKLTTLQTLVLEGTNCSEPGIRRLSEQLPSTDIQP